MSTKMDEDDWAHTLGCFAPACPGADRKPRTIAASSRRFISLPSRTFAGVLCRSASVLGTVNEHGNGTPDFH
jgi:hypothetical protein